MLKQINWYMASTIQKLLRQKRPFASAEAEVFLGVQILADRLMAPWARYLRQQADLSPAQYNVLRILRGAGPEGLWAGDISGRLITRCPDVTRLVDRLEQRGFVRRGQDPEDRRAVRVHITRAGLDVIAPLDAQGKRELRRTLSAVPQRHLEALRTGLNEVLASFDAQD